MSRLISSRSRILLLFIGLALLSTEKGRSQTNGAMLGLGIQTSAMEDMKYLQDYILGAYPVEGKTISSFPAYTMGSLAWIHQLYPMVRISAGYAYSTTGAKSNYTDYTGSITTLMDAVSHRAAASISYSLIDGDWFEISVLGRVNMKYTRMDISTNLYALGASGRTEGSYTSWSPGVAGAAEFMVHLEKYSFGVEGGYELDAQGKLSNNEDKSDLLDPNNPERVLTTDWTGWFAQARFILWFGF